MKWFKFYGQDYLSDPKILALSACERSCWITLLSYGSVNDNGKITFLSEEQLMAQSGISPMHEEWKNTKGVLEKLEKLEIIKIDNGVITLLNWIKRQETNLTGYERVKRYREKKRDDNTKITLDKIRIDKNIIMPDKPAINKKDLIEKLGLKQPLRGNNNQWQDEAAASKDTLKCPPDKISALFKCFKDNQSTARIALSDCKELGKCDVRYFFKVFSEIKKKQVN